MTNLISVPMNAKQWSMLVFLSVVWGGSYYFMEIILRALSPVVIVAIRIILAAIILNIVLFFSGYSLPRNMRLWCAFAVMGLLCNVLPFCLIAWGQIFIGSGLASILNATTPLFTIVVAHYWTSDERYTVNRVVGLIAGFLGVIVLLSPSISFEGSDYLLAQIAILVASIFYAVAAVYGRRFKAFGLQPLAVASGQLTASGFLLLPIVFFTDYLFNFSAANYGTWIAMLGLAAFSTALAFLIYFRLLESAGATNLSLVTFLIPVTAVLLGMVFLNERLNAAQCVGMSLIALGLLVIDGRGIAFLKLKLSR